MHIKKKYNNEGRTYLQGLRPFGNHLPKNLRQIFKKRGFLYFEILTKWKIIVGERISKISHPKSLKSKTNDGSTLFLAVERGNEFDIEYSKDHIIAKINSFFGYNLINKIRLVPFSIVSKNNANKNKVLLKKNLAIFEKKIKDINSEKIKNALLELINSAKI